MKKIAFVVITVFILVILASCGGPSGEAAEPYSYESMCAQLIECADSGKTHVEMPFSGILAADKEKINSDLSAAVNSYEVGSRIENLDITYKSEMGYYLVIADMTLSERPKPQFTVSQYSREALRGCLYETVTGGDEEMTAVFMTDSKIESSAVNDDIKAIQSSDVHIAYLTTQFVSTVYAYTDAVEIHVKVDYREDTVKDIADTTGMTDMQIIQLMIDEFTSWDEKVALYSDKGADIEYITGLATEAYANDCRDIVCEPVGIRTQRYTGEDGVITEVYLDFAADRDECGKRVKVMRDAIDSAVEELRAETEGMSDEERLAAACRKILSSADYAQEIADTPQKSMTEEMFFDRTAYGALVSGQTVCTGYSYALKAICDGLDIPCWVVFGKLYDGDDHAWNAVMIDGRMTYVDVTFMNSGHNEYFMFDRALYSADGRADFPGWVMPFE